MCLVSLYIVEYPYILEKSMVGYQVNYWTLDIIRNKFIYLFICDVEFICVVVEHVTLLITFSILKKRKKVFHTVFGLF